MNIVVTGGCGFIGAHLVRSLADLGHHVLIIDTAPRVVGRPVDVRDTKTLTALLSGYDLVIHAAALNSSTAGFYERPAEVMDVGVKGALSLVEAMQKAGVPDLIVFSSSEVLGEPSVFPTPETAPIQISDPSNPRWSYAISKAVTEMVALHAPGLRRVQVVRPFNIYGKGQAVGHVIPDLLTQARVPGPITIQGDGSDSRAYCHVDDFVEGVILMARHGGPGIYHIGNDREATVRELVEIIAPGREVVAGESPAGSPKRRAPDISKMRALGYEPKVSIEDGIASLLNSGP